MSIIVTLKSEFSLVDGDERHDKYPDTFYMPPMAERESLDVGAIVKVIAEKEGEVGERFWVTIICVVEKGVYVGTVSNKLTICDFDRDDTIGFYCHNVVEIYEADEIAA